MPPPPPPPPPPRNFLILNLNSVKNIQVNKLMWKIQQNNPIWDLSTEIKWHVNLESHSSEDQNTLRVGKWLGSDGFPKSQMQSSPSSAPETRRFGERLQNSRPRTCRKCQNHTYSHNSHEILTNSCWTTYRTSMLFKASHKCAINFIKIGVEKIASEMQF